MKLAEVRERGFAMPLKVISASHYVTDLTLGLGTVVFDYLN